MMRAILCVMLRVYKRLFSPILSRWLCCRFHPSCSDYASIAIQKYGATRGLRMTVKRLSRCRPDNIDSCIDFP
ncbi:membrane protein insertion efficiency factor YidD [Bdellovibrionota bacterium FG-2]